MNEFAKTAATPSKGQIKARKTATERNPQVQSLTRALIILEKLSEHDNGLTLTELARLGELPTSTTHRLLTTLENRRFVRFNRTSNLWSVGVQSFVVGNTFARSRNFVPLAKIFMRHLMDQAGETVNLATHDQEGIVYLAQVECREIVRAFVRPGSRAPIHSSAVGKAILAAMPDVDRNRITQPQIPNSNDITQFFTENFMNELEDVRQRGYAIDDEEQSVGVRCVASVIYDENGGPLAAVSISGPTARITNDRIPAIGELVRKTCKDITSNLGGRQPSEIDLPVQAVAIG
ncbi:MAG: IclR family transcriptional regulator [Rhodospirillaceae bacterium]|nr:IclR family transcriptional regulator [Rhodospirillaceae bacterium]